MMIKQGWKLFEDAFLKFYEMGKSSTEKSLPTLKEGMTFVVHETNVTDIVKSPKLTADWENKLTLVAKGELSDAVFMGGIDAMIQALIVENKEPKAEYRALFP